MLLKRQRIMLVDNRRQKSAATPKEYVPQFERGICCVCVRVCFVVSFVSFCFVGWLWVYGCCESLCCLCFLLSPIVRTGDRGPRQSTTLRRILCGRRGILCGTRNAERNADLN